MSKGARANVVLPRPRGEAARHHTLPGNCTARHAARGSADRASDSANRPAHRHRSYMPHAQHTRPRQHREQRLARPSTGPAQRSVTRASGDRDERDDGADARKRRACRRATPPGWRTTRHRPPPPLPKFGSGARIPTAPTLLALAGRRDSGGAVCCGVHDHIAVDHAATGASARSTHNGAAPAPRPGGSPGGIAPFMGGSYCPLGGG